VFPRLQKPCATHCPLLEGQPLLEPARILPHELRLRGPSGRRFHGQGHGGSDGFVSQTSHPLFRIHYSHMGTAPGCRWIRPDVRNAVGLTDPLDVSLPPFRAMVLRCGYTVLGPGRPCIGLGPGGTRRHLAMDLRRLEQQVARCGQIGVPICAVFQPFSDPFSAQSSCWRCFGTSGDRGQQRARC